MSSWEGIVLGEFMILRIKYLSKINSGGIHKRETRIKITIRIKIIIK